MVALAAHSSLLLLLWEEQQMHSKKLRWNRNEIGQRKLSALDQLWWLQLQNDSFYLLLFQLMLEEWKNFVQTTTESAL